MKQRILSLFLIMITLLSLVACGGEDVTTAPTTTTAPPSGTTLAHALKDAGYTLKYPRRASSEVEELAKSIARAFQLITGSPLSVDTDRVNEREGETLPHNNNEILLGITNRASSQALLAQMEANRKNCAKDRKIVMKDKEVLIMAGNDAYLEEAVREFIAMLSMPRAQFDLVQGYDSGWQLYDWELTVLGGKPITDYRIVIPKSNPHPMQTHAKELQTILYRICGFRLEIVTDEASAPADCEILLGRTNRPLSAQLAEELSTLTDPDYMIRGSGTTIALLAANDAWGSDRAVNRLGELILEGQKDNISIELAQTTVFSPDQPTSKPSVPISGGQIQQPAGTISVADASQKALENGALFANEIAASVVSDFEKPGDQMVHVSTFSVIDGMIYMTYYANTETAAENPDNQRARFVYCPVADPTQKVFFDIQAVGDDCYGAKVTGVYDTIMAQADEDTIFILWTARIGTLYYRLYRIFTISTQELGPVGVNRFQVGEVTNDFSASGITSALRENGIGCKTMYSDIGIMQKFTTRIEDGQTYYYTGAYSGDMNMIIKSKDFITWEYVSQPSFVNKSKWENAVYVLNDKVYYFVRQHDEYDHGFLTYYDLTTETWAAPVLVEDSQSRSDFILYNGELYLFFAPIDRNHIGILRIDTETLAESEIVLIADMRGSCFYPFITYFGEGELAMSYTVSRKHIRLAKFTLSKYLE